jgi:hypothetical protein
MSCIISSGYALGCKDSVGGLRYVYLGNFSENETYGLDADNQITGVTSGTTYYKFELRPQTAGFNETINSSVENGTLFHTQELTLAFDKNTVELRNQVYLLSQSEMRAIIFDQNGKYRLAGKVNGLNVTAGTIPTGIQYADRNGVELTLVAHEPQPANFISDAGFATFTLG